MIRQMRVKFIYIAMTSGILMLGVILITINLFMANSVKVQVDAFLEHAMLNDGRIEGPGNPSGKAEREEHQDAPHPENQGHMPMIEGISFVMTNEGTIHEVIDNREAMSEVLMVEYGSVALASGQEHGSIGGYRYMYKQEGEGWIVVLANRAVQDDLLQGLLEISLAIGGACVVLIFAVVAFLSRYITRPVEIAFDKQKRFISDSSHELKTPLSVMSANLDMLQMEVGDNKRILAIDQGIKRMNGLIHELLTLVRTEQSSEAHRVLNLTELMEGVILPLEVLAFEHGNKIEYTLEENIKLVGDEEGLRKMVGALMENAIKYSRSETVIQVTLYRKGHNRIIEVFNEGDGVTDEQKDRLFDKFYRVDHARQRSTGGYGIGLSIVKNVVDLHRGKIILDSEPGQYIVFRVSLPVKSQ